MDGGEPQHPDNRESPPRDDAGAGLHMLYPQAYTWLILVSALDIMFTWVVLHFGGREVNLLADLIIDSSGLWGLLVFKFGLVVLSIVICEEVGRRRRETGKRLSWLAVVISATPVIAAIVQLLLHRSAS